MVCGNCGATIADKAIVCYRCGTPTAIPDVPRRTPPPSPARPWLVVVLLVAAAGVLGWLAAGEVAGSVRQIVYAAAGLALLAAGGWLAVGPRRGKVR
ncbi:MAG: hypothetical protein DIU54_012125 [Acidobacteriota bacterium]|jgi:anti-sigma factor RsiW|nr:MAG: hypothetical protein DIU54_00095 [Acidobacteriota bacterium]